MLSKEEIQRYARHLSLDGVGQEGQEKIKSAKVLVIGAGGLGCPALQYLTAAGVGTIGIVDHDVVDESNLHRQILFTSKDIGQSKAQTAVERLKAHNPFVTIHAINTRLTNENALELFGQYDIILDGSDNFPTRYLVNDACVMCDKPFVYGSIYKFEGQVAVFNYQNGPSYRCLHPVPPQAGEVPNCSDVGVLGVLPGVIGTRMAAECLKLILGIGTPLSGKLLVMDLLGNQTMMVAVQRDENQFQREALEDSYEAICGVPAMPTEISAKGLHNELQAGNSFILIDVREAFEWDICHIEGSIHIPLGEIPQRSNEIDKDLPTIVLCHHGMRSASAIDYLGQIGYNNLINLQGGIHAWATEVDPEMTTY